MIPAICAGSAVAEPSEIKHLPLPTEAVKVSEKSAPDMYWGVDQSHVQISIGTYEKLRDAYLDNQLRGELVDGVLEYKKGILDSLINAVGVVFTVLSFFFALLIFCGFKGINDMKAELREEIKQLTSNAQDNINSALEKKFTELTDAVYGRVMESLSNDKKGGTPPPPDDRNAFGG